jgi:apolipoprotein D and lipocalin family protein
MLLTKSFLQILNFDKMRIQAILIASLALLGRMTQAVAPLAAVPNLDVDQYKGLWYSVAEIPYSQGSESQCTSAQTVVYTPFFEGSNSLDFTESCIVARYGPATLKREVSGTITRLDNSGKFSADLNQVTAIRYEYIVPILAKDYSYSVVGTSDRDTLFIQSRKPELDNSTFVYLEQELSAKLRFDTRKIVITQEGESHGKSLASLAVTLKELIEVKKKFFF